MTPMKYARLTVADWQLYPIIEAYKKGAEWCNYGWTQGQLATYPTQKNLG